MQAPCKTYANPLDLLMFFCGVVGFVFFVVFVFLAVVFQIPIPRKIQPVAFLMKNTMILSFLVWPCLGHMISGPSRGYFQNPSFPGLNEIF